MKKVMFHLHCLRKGGAERVVVNLAERFAAQGDQVVIALAHQAEDDYRISEGIRKLFVGLTPQEERRNGRLHNFLARVRRLGGAIRAEKPDILIAFGKSPNYRTMLAKAGTGIPAIVSVRNDPGMDYSGKGNAVFNRLLLERAEGCVFQTEEAKAFFGRGLRQRSRIILNPIHDKYLSASRSKGQRDKRIVTVGRLAAQKNQLLLLRAFEGLREEFPDYVLELYGGKTQDDTAARLEQYVREHGLSEAVRFMGIRDDLDRRLPDAAVFVLSSDYEGLPNVLMEAMAMGLPVVATDCPCGGPRALIRDGVNGLLVPVGDKEALQEALASLLKDPDRAERLGENAQRIKEPANTDVIFRQWDTYAEELITKRRRSGLAGCGRNARRGR